MKSHIQQYPGSFQYKQTLVRFSVWSNTDGRTAIDTIIFLGSAQVGKIPKWVAEAAPAGVAVIDGLPHWIADPSADDLELFTNEYSKAALQTVLATFNIPSANIIAISQAAPGAVWAAKNFPDQVMNVALVAPLGLNTTYYGPSQDLRLRRLKLRTLRTYFQFSYLPFHDIRVMYLQFMLMRSFLLETEWGATDRKYGLGISFDLLHDCRIVALQRFKRKSTFTVYLAEKDKIFPPHEIMASLKQAQIEHITTVMLPGLPHPSFAIRSAQKSLARVINDTRRP